jgi:hypothetical protein
VSESGAKEKYMDGWGHERLSKKELENGYCAFVSAVRRSGLHAASAAICKEDMDPGPQPVMMTGAVQPVTTTFVHI